MLKPKTGRDRSCRGKTVAELTVGKESGRSDSQITAQITVANVTSATEVWK